MKILYPGANYVDLYKEEFPAENESRLIWKNISFCSVVDLSHLTSSIPSLQEFPLVCLPYNDR